ncbi:MAG TPA: Glu-tRNA(Gln) amidotransferase subunit GatE [Pyrodictiaceae archaeon]|nr:Glu-tRNA(Gln) amidotransferase subunit GatE [Pyrodictiaceae archaeon]HIQ56010.1 Glu-tRNA(Gln) amidotransferase subunit GatE [Pyrodictium sp.]
MVEKKLDVAKYDPRKLGVRVGLEIHQQLDTKHKLFCRCPTELVEHPPEKPAFARRLRPTRSELGEVDIAALFEWRKGRIYEYYAPSECSCLVEADEEPPHSLNRDALVIGLSIALALHAKPVDEVHVMRKIVIDGSNTTGFQRTAIIALGGYIELPSGKKIRIQTIAIEEDAARKVDEQGNSVRFLLDRMGIPLIEISTAPDIETPEEAYETAFTIGQLMRLTGKVKRGIGTIRQDLNVSIRGGVKTEIKGVQRLDLLPKVVLYEAIRQARLLEIMEELKKRGITPQDIERESKIVDVTNVFKNTKSKIIRRMLSKGGRVYAVKLPGFHGLLGVEVQPGRRFGTELADYARFWGGVGGIFHSDELPGYGISEEEVSRIFELLNARKGVDAIVIVADKPKAAKKALEAVVERAKMAIIGIPKETRAALPDGTTKFMRPQPGAARMYPETDIPPVEITDTILAEANKLKPVHPLVKLRELKTKYGLSEQLAQQILRCVHLDFYEHLVEKYGDKVTPTYIASIFVNILRNLEREGVPIENLSEKHIEDVVRALAEHKVVKDIVPQILEFLAKNPAKNVEEAIKTLGVGTVSLKEVEKLVEEAVEALREEIMKRGMASLSKVMGRVMPMLRGKIEGRIVAEIAKKKISEMLKKHR